MFRKNDVVRDLSDLGELGKVVFVEAQGYWIQFKSDKGSHYYDRKYAHKNFERVEGKTVVLKPDEKWDPDLKTCTCGVDKIGVGKHSHWCDLFKEVS